MSRHSCLIIDERYISKIIAQEKTWELRRKPTKKREVIALGKKGTSKAIGTAEIADCFQMSVNTLCQEKYKDKHCSTPDSIREYTWGKDKQKHLSSLWV
ncbi:MAG: ASCH domain-containing protein [Candidatus Bathyarchaeota archaeon]|nr:ASCH domain-containing protein [Candidatus Bathyarchaeota archaeon]